MIIIKSSFIKIMLILLMTILIIGCTSQETSNTSEPPELFITIGDKELEYVIGKNKWNGVVYDRQDTFKTILKEGSSNEIPYIEISKTAVITFKSHPPALLTISDVLIDKSGNQIYPDKLSEDIPVELKDGMCSFEIKNNMASALSSFYVESKTDIRGFRIIASWGENECEYAFIIRTDAI